MEETGLITIMFVTTENECRQKIDNNRDMANRKFSQSSRARRKTKRYLRDLRRKPAHRDFSLVL